MANILTFPRPLPSRRHRRRRHSSPKSRESSSHSTTTSSRHSPGELSRVGETVDSTIVVGSCHAPPRFQNLAVVAAKRAVAAVAARQRLDPQFRRPRARWRVGGCRRVRSASLVTRRLATARRCVRPPPVGRRRQLTAAVAVAGQRSALVCLPPSDDCRATRIVGGCGDWPFKSPPNARFHCFADCRVQQPSRCSLSSARSFAHPRRPTADRRTATPRHNRRATTTSDGHLASAASF